MKKLFVLLVLIVPIALSAQTAKIAWEESASDLATAQSYTYKAYVGASTSGITLTNVVCANGPAAGIFTCTVTAPAVFMGNGIQLTATNLIGESSKSTTFPFPNLPATPVNLRAQ